MNAPLLKASVSRRALLTGSGAVIASALLPGYAQTIGVRSYRQYADCRYGQIHVRIAEPGVGMLVTKPPLVCLHQSPGSGMEFIEFQAAMATDRMVLCPDTAGYGASDGPLAQPSIEDYAGALADGLTALGYGDGGGGPVDVLGYHTGNFIAIELANSRPDLVRRLVMPSIPYYPEGEREELRVRYAQPRPYFTDPDYLGESYRKTVLEVDNGVARARLHDLFVSRLRAGPDSHFGFDAVFRYDADRALAQLTQPVLMPIMNETLGEPTRAASKFISNGEVVERLDLSNLAWILKAGEMVEMVRDFLDQPPPPDLPPMPKTPLKIGKVEDGLRHWRHYADNRYGQMHFTSAMPERGSEHTPVALFHQSPLSAVIFKELIAALATDRMVHGADTPGFGDSDGPASQPAMTDLGGATAEALRELGYGESNPIDLFGFHTGSLVAIEVARQAPELVRRVILCGVPYYPADERLDRQNQFLRPYAFLTDPSYVDEMYKRMVPNGDGKIPQERRLERFTDRMRAGPKGEWGPRAVFAYDADAGLTALTQSTLLMAFEEVMTEPTREAHKLKPDAEFVHLPELDMMGFLDQPDRVANAMRDFLDRG